MFSGNSGNSEASTSDGSSSVVSIVVLGSVSSVGGVGLSSLNYFHFHLIFLFTPRTTFILLPSCMRVFSFTFATSFSDHYFHSSLFTMYPITANAPAK